MTKTYQSESVKALAAALSKAQGKMEHAKKQSENPAFKRGDNPSTYADLPAIIDVFKPHFAENGLSTLQFTDIDEAGNVVMMTQIMHESGEWIRGYYPVKPVQSTPQGLGSAITYARRYSLGAITGAAAHGEDDDGNKASEKQQEPRKTNAPVARPTGTVTQVPLNTSLVSYFIEPLMRDGKFDYTKFKDDIIHCLDNKAKTVEDLDNYKNGNKGVLNAMKKDDDKTFKAIVAHFEVVAKTIAEGK
ncbi:MAG: ERF family protein [Sterolibacterium sp.]